jgi:hypothetical protein
MTCELINQQGQRLSLELTDSDGRMATTLIVNGVPCHFECLSQRGAQAYLLDDDPDYAPATDHDGKTFLMVPFSRG